MANIKLIHDALLTLHKEFDVLNKDNERIQGIVDGMEAKLKELKREHLHPTPPLVKVPKKKRKLTQKHKMKISDAMLVKTKKKMTASSGNGSTLTKRAPVTEDIKAEIIRLGKEGKLTQREIGTRTGTTQTTVSKTMRQAGVYRKKNGETIDADVR